ncbi:VOC family protein [Mycobacterium manitobense]|uniref:VOC family protein n=1 Tax=[Mycobacterium] manitobense TaxID=190147 RepID=A0A9X3BP59_9MYCO|nr:VOC family protein [[Mycobacterium] manitobense]MCV7171780.1 VOC family protein [[Mycobacterium] manitobense]
MALAVEMITFDCDDPDGLAQWWAQAVDGEVTPFAPGEFVVVIRPDGPRLGFQRVPDPTPGKNRVHLDFTAGDMEAEVARLVGLGATETGRNNFGDEFRWVTLADPAGNAFCVAEG